MSSLLSNASSRFASRSLASRLQMVMNSIRVSAEERSRIERRNSVRRTCRIGALSSAAASFGTRLKFGKSLAYPNTSPAPWVQVYTSRRFLSTVTRTLPFWTM